MGGDIRYRINLQLRSSKIGPDQKGRRSVIFTLFVCMLPEYLPLPPANSVKRWYTVLEWTTLKFRTKEQGDNTLTKKHQA